MATEVIEYGLLGAIIVAGVPLMNKLLDRVFNVQSTVTESYHQFVEELTKLMKEQTQAQIKTNQILAMLQTEITNNTALLKQLTRDQVNGPDNRT